MLADWVSRSHREEKNDERFPRVAVAPAGRWLDLMLVLAFKRDLPFIESVMWRRLSNMVMRSRERYPDCDILDKISTLCETPEVQLVDFGPLLEDAAKWDKGHLCSLPKIAPNVRNCAALQTLRDIDIRDDAEVKRRVCALYLNGANQQAMGNCHNQIRKKFFGDYCPKGRDRQGKEPGYAEAQTQEERRAVAALPFFEATVKELDDSPNPFGRSGFPIGPEHVYGIDDVAPVRAVPGIAQWGDVQLTSTLPKGIHEWGHNPGRDTELRPGDKVQGVMGNERRLEYFCKDVRRLPSARLVFAPKFPRQGIDGLPDHWKVRTVGEARLRNAGLNAVGVLHENGVWEAATKDTVLKPHDLLILTEEAAKGKRRQLLELCALHGEPVPPPFFQPPSPAWWELCALHGEPVPPPFFQPPSPAWWQWGWASPSL